MTAKSVRTSSESPLQRALKVSPHMVPKEGKVAQGIVISYGTDSSAIEEQNETEIK